jgi:DNA-binding Lrp family transcriptional regulator
MIVRNRRDLFYQAEYELAQLVQERKELFRRCYSFYGHYDLVIPVEANSLQQIHQAVNTIQARGGDSVFSTITSVVVDPVTDNPKRFDGNQVCVGIITQLGRQNDVRNRLEAIPGFDLADVVFGEFDIIALFHPNGQGALGVLRQAIREIEYIQKTTTMLPHTIALL